MIYELIGVGVTFVLTVILGPFVIKLMKKFKVKNVQREYLNQDNELKGKTPSMGGFMFMIPVILVSVGIGIFKKETDFFALSILVAVFSVIGFLDDYLKVKKHSKDGLAWWQKMAGQLITSAAFAVYLQYFTDYSKLSLRVLGVEYEYSLGLLYIPFVIFLMVAESNGVNVTDGIDGLVGGTSSIVLVFFIVCGLTFYDNDVLSIYSAIFLGGILGFLVYNIHPAKIFMGDVGSLALGGAIGALALISRHPFVILFVGLIYAIEIIIDVLQIDYFKITKKIYGVPRRIVPRAPVHHSFQSIGWGDVKIAIVFCIFTAICVAGTFFLIK